MRSFVSLYAIQKKLVPKLSKFLKLNCEGRLVRQSCLYMSLTITKMDSTVQISCAFSERSQETEIQVVALTRGMYVSPAIKMSEHWWNFRRIYRVTKDLRKFCSALVRSVLCPLGVLKALSSPQALAPWNNIQVSQELLLKENWLISLCQFTLILY